MSRLCGLVVAMALALTLVHARAAPFGGARLQPRLYDIVIKGGRVMDPETGLDAPRDVAISQGRIVRIGESLTGTTTIEGKGLVVAPGFIDLHSHGQSPENYRLKAFDGVTTALELEIGVPDVAGFIASRKGKALVHYGATIAHAGARVAAFGAPLAPGTLLPPSGPATNAPASPEQLQRMRQLIAAGLDAGALGIGIGLAYTPGATRREIIDTFRLAAERRVPIYTHVRNTGSIEPGSAIEAVSEVIGASAITGAPVHVVHVNSTCRADAMECLRMIEGARGRGLDVTVEAYPYGFGMTAINSAIFNEGWREKMGIDYDGLREVDTGKPLTEQRFKELRASPEPKMVLVYGNPDEMVDAIIIHPLVMIASDGLMENGRGHPRAAGTYARIIARYVRAQGKLTLMDAIRKMTLMPARRLEYGSSAARHKGRLQEGADADIVLFDPQTFTDRATYQSPAEPSVGVRHLIVAGTPVIRDGRIIEGVAPGQPLLGDDR
jgi:N-acyl-D-aspartate/D-glutamate deacylase